MLTEYSVTSYDKETATLILEHNCPVGNRIKALVNIQLLLSSLKSHETRVGEWVNVVGYIVGLKGQQDSRDRPVETGINLRAIVLWSSGPIQLDAYERSLMLRE